MDRDQWTAGLNRPPSRVWPDAVLHHGVRLLVLVGLAVAVSFLFPVAPLPDLPPVERGSVLEEDVIAEVPFDVMKSPTRLERERQDAAAAVNPVFVFDSTAIDSALAGVDRLFASVDSTLVAADSAEAERRLRDLLAASGLPTGAPELSIMRDERWRETLRRTARTVILDELPRGIAERGALEEASAPTLRIRGLDRERTLPTDSVLQMVDLYDRARLYVPPGAPVGYEQLQRLLLVRNAVPSLTPDWGATRQAREAARAAVAPIQERFVEGQRIVPAREPVTEEEVERYRAYLEQLQAQNGVTGARRGLRVAGAFLFNLVVLSLFGVLLYFYRAPVYRNFRHVSLVAFLILALVGTAALVARYDQPATLVPIAFPALAVAILWDGRMALNLSLIMAILLSGQSPFLGVVALTTLVTGGAVASLSVRVVRRRAQIWGFIALIAGGYVLVSIILGFLQSWTWLEIAGSAGWGGLNAVASAFAAMGFLPLFEGYTRITTDQTLLELADMNRPLLRRLSREAPGTYAHSINVANLAEAAAAGIDANALLTRVGVYYHDVGKMERPQYFIENQLSGRNPHNRLKPATSAQVVRNHVVEGLRLAEEEKLPDCVTAFIAEHHGTQSISFFLEQAREREPDADHDPRDFAYPGPRPRSRETAIVMLADSVESAARVLPDPNPASIRELVDRIVRTKMEAGQLDEAPLTLRELSVVKEQFVSVLSGMYHQRIDYPPASGGPEPAEQGPVGQEAAARDAAAAQSGGAEEDAARNGTVPDGGSPAGEARAEARR